MFLNYHQLLSYVFRRFSILGAFRTGIATAGYYMHREPLPPSERPALFTMNILPPMMTVWYHCARKALGDRVDITIFDCSGRLRPEEFPGARVQKFLNVYAATKCEEFLYHIARHREIGWLCDDDVFFRDGAAVDLVLRELAVPGTASVSFRPRSWWHFEIDGRTYEPSSSYCIAYHRKIFCDTEHLRLGPCGGNTHPSRTGKNERRYDTGDKANEILLQKGYRCFIVPEGERTRFIIPFTGVSGAVMLLWYFRTPQQTLDYFLTPPLERWRGNVLYGVLCAMLAVDTIQECYTRLCGRPYPLRALPSHDALMRLRESRKPYLREDQSFAWVDAAREQLLAAL